MDDLENLQNYDMDDIPSFSDYYSGNFSWDDCYGYWNSSYSWNYSSYYTSSSWNWSNATLREQYWNNSWGNYSTWEGYYGYYGYYGCFGYGNMNYDIPNLGDY